MARRIAVLISGSGTNLQALIDAQNTPALPNAEIVLVFSNRKAAYGLTRAVEANIPTGYLALKTFLNSNPGKSRDDYDAEVARRVFESWPDLVVLAGWMHVFGDGFLNIARDAKDGQGVPVINLHPALPGAFDGANAIERAYEAFQKGEISHSGVMVHRVVRDVDRGEPLIVREIALTAETSLDDFAKRLHAVEWEIIVQASKMVLEESVSAPP
ncbi:unnamed protein product [Mycena citricolor]|uniref:Phosphoribosylglycinamide formyltransferase n=1 Tax=Mycena citricolor TaxID=2018698 RepID=A0AAD2GV37_9AGAR|nr:unnamed protein product [Mycena citricolor]